MARLLIGLITIGAVALLYVGVVTNRAVERISHERPPTTAFMRHSAATASRVDQPTAWTHLSALPPFVTCAFVKAEDREFFRHHGFDGAQLFRAASGAITGTRHMGGSTISQQLARNLFLSDERSMRRKVAEAAYSVLLERRLSKREMLELYLNIIEFGPDVWGIDAASRHYFGVPPESLSLGRATFLASILPDPRHAATSNPRVRAVEMRVLAELWASGMISEAMLDSAARSLSLPPLRRAGAQAFLARDDRARLSGSIADASGGADCGLAREKELQRHPERRIAKVP
ncbi:MAG: biosynthetic peptidoglycan transglycosylase [bacterium]